MAGIYLIARPGPYINAETSGGGFPGWLGRLQGRLKTTDQDYLDAITPYISTVGSIIAKAQVVNGGPIILVQPENEYTFCANTTGYTQFNNITLIWKDTSCLEKSYMGYVENELRKAGIVVPFIVNDDAPWGKFAPGTGTGAVDIYSFDNYPLGWTTARMSRFLYLFPLIMLRSILIPQELWIRRIGLHSLIHWVCTSLHNTDGSAPRRHSPSQNFREGVQMHGMDI